MRLPSRRLEGAVSPRLSQVHRDGCVCAGWKHASRRSTVEIRATYPWLSVGLDYSIGSGCIRASGSDWALNIGKPKPLPGAGVSANARQLSSHHSKRLMREVIPQMKAVLLRRDAVRCFGSTRPSLLSVVLGEVGIKSQRSRATRGAWSA